MCIPTSLCVRDGHRTAYLLTHVPTYLCDVHRTTSPTTSTRSWWAGNPCRTRCAVRTPSSLRWTAPTWPWSCPRPRRRERNWRSAMPSSTSMAPWQSLRSELAPAVERQSSLVFPWEKWSVCAFVVVDCFYMALFSALEHTHCAFTACDSEWVTVAFYRTFWISTEMVYLQLCVVVTWLVTRETAALSTHSVRTI